MTNKVRLRSVVSVLLLTLLPSLLLGLSACKYSEHQGFDCTLEDQSGVPTASVSSEKHWYGCMGYLHGRDRAWQMDYLRRTARGQRAEVFGSDYEEADGFLRFLHLGEEADRLVRELSDHDRMLLERYAEGANEGIAQTLAENSDPARHAAREFTQIGYKPATWTPADTLVVLMLQAFSNSQDSYEIELNETEAYQRFGALAPKLMSPDGLPWDVSILREGEFEPASRSAKIDSVLERLHLPNVRLNPQRTGLSGVEATLSADTRAISAYLQRVMPHRGTGSNSWAVAPSRSATGHAWFSNDPHVELGYPTFWYTAVIRGPSQSIYGVSVPGVPFIASGATDKISWGLTTSFIDVAELYFLPADEAVKGLPAYSVALPVAGLPGYATVLRWSGYATHGDDISAFLHLREAKSVDDMDSRISAMHIPTWNLVFVDRNGDIGYRSTGRFPRHVGPQPFGMQVYQKSAEVPSWEFLSSEESPHVLRPKRPFLVTANNRQWPVQAKLSAGRAHEPGFRATRIEELLNAQPKHSLETLQRTQCDSKSVDASYYAPRFAERLKTLGKPDGVDQAVFDQAMAQIPTWDFRTGVDCTLCGLYHKWLDVVRSEGLTWNGVMRALDEPAMKDTVDRLVSSGFQRSVTDWTQLKGTPFVVWGDVHKASFLHPLGRSAFDPGGSLPAAGDRHTVSPGTSSWDNDHYEVSSGASHRLIVEMTEDGPRIWRALAGPNSARDDVRVDAPDSPWQKWSKCQYQEINL